MYDVHRLRLLRELQLRGTLAAVADALGYSPSSVSHQLAILEREVGVALLEPHGRRVRLTHAAGVLVSHAGEILLELERAETAMAALHGEVAGVLRVATFQTAAYTLVLDMIDSLAHEYPGVMVEVAHIHTHAAIPALRARDFDLVLYEEYPGAAGPPQKDLVTEILLEDPMLLVTPTTSAAACPADLSDARWVAEPAGAPARTWTTAICRAAGFEPIVAFETADVLLHLRLVAEGRAVALVPRLALTPATAVRAVALDASRTISCAVRRGSEDTPVIAAARTALRRHAADLSTHGPAV